MIDLAFDQLRVRAVSSEDASLEVLTESAMRFVGYLCNKFENRRQSLLDARRVRALQLDAGEVPCFLRSCDENQNGINNACYDSSWKCADIPDEVMDRRVEITGPVDRKMVINGLNSGACVYMADLEDSTSPTWTNVLAGQINLRDAVRGTISTVSKGKLYKLNEQTAVLFVRPRGWHLNEVHIVVNGKPASAAIVDFALYLFHNHSPLQAKGSRPYFYLPKIETSLEAALWDDIFVASQEYLGLPIGTIRATVLLETITAAFEMEEILYHLRRHSLGLNCGRWDYLFSYVKKFKAHSDKITPDRSHLTMTTPLMEAYVHRLIYVCHKRGTFAMGGMSASIPIKNDPNANAAAMKKVQDDKEREVHAGHDGTWVAHPALVKVAKDVFDAHMTTPNQILTKPCSKGAMVAESDLLRLPSVPAGKGITSDGLTRGIGIVLAYCEAWLRGVGCIPLHNAMEDAATAEISRAQIWQWRKHHARTEDDNQTITSSRISDLVRKNVCQRVETVGSEGKWALAGKLVEEMLNADEFDDFLTTVCYPHVVAPDQVTSLCE